MVVAIRSKVASVSALLVRTGKLPPHLPGSDRFKVPVGPLDQADRDRDVLRFCPAQQLIQIAVTVVQIGLQHDAEMRIVAKFQFQAAVDLQNNPFEAIGFHVDAEEGAGLDDPLSQPAQGGQHPLNRTGEIHRDWPGSKALSVLLPG